MLGLVKTIVLARELRLVLELVKTIVQASSRVKGRAIVKAG